MMEKSLLDKMYTLINGILHLNEGDPSDAGSPERICPITGLDISMQAKNSKFLSATGVRWYYEHKPLVYAEILLPYLTDYWKDSSQRAKYREIAHNIRNKESNRRNSMRRRITQILKDKNSLFNPADLIDKRRLKEAGMDSFEL